MDSPMVVTPAKTGIQIFHTLLKQLLTDLALNTPGDKLRRNDETGFHLKPGSGKSWKIWKNP